VTCLGDPAEEDSPLWDVLSVPSIVPGFSLSFLVDLWFWCTVVRSLDSTRLIPETMFLTGVPVTSIRREFPAGRCGLGPLCPPLRDPLGHPASCSPLLGTRHTRVHGNQTSLLRLAEAIWSHQTPRWCLSTWQSGLSQEAKRDCFPNLPSSFSTAHRGAVFAAQLNASLFLVWKTVAGVVFALSPLGPGLHPLLGFPTPITCRHFSQVHLIPQSSMSMTPT